MIKFRYINKLASQYFPNRIDINRPMLKFSGKTYYKYAMWIFNRIIYNNLFIRVSIY